MRRDSSHNGHGMQLFTHPEVLNSPHAPQSHVKSCKLLDFTCMCELIKGAFVYPLTCDESLQMTPCVVTIRSETNIQIILPFIHHHLMYSDVP